MATTKIDKNIQKNITLLREKSGLKKSELAQILNVDRSRISYFESGKVKPNDDIKTAICDYFHVSMDYLYGRTKIKNPNFTFLKNEDRAFLLQYIEDCKKKYKEEQEKK